MNINGIELDFELFDSKNTKLRKRYFQELKKFRGIAKTIPKNLDEKEQMEYLCNKIKKLFDKVFSPGIGDTVCGSGCNLLVCMDAYEQLVSEQIRQNEKYNAIMDKIRGGKKDKFLRQEESYPTLVEMNGDMDESVD